MYCSSCQTMILEGISQKVLVFIYLFIYQCMDLFLNITDLQLLFFPVLTTMLNVNHKRHLWKSLLLWQWLEVHRCSIFHGWVVVILFWIQLHSSQKQIDTFPFYLICWGWPVVSRVPSQFLLLIGERYYPSVFLSVCIHFTFSSCHYFFKW